MRKSIKAVFAVGSVALIISGSAMAAGALVPTLGNMNFGDTNTTTAEADCVTAIGAGAICQNLVTGSGFVQRQIEFGGNTYIQTIIDDGQGFKSEDYVQVKFGGTAGSGVQGVASNLSLASGDYDSNLQVNTAAGKAGFVTESTIFTGWAHDPAKPNDAKAVIRVDIGDNTDAAKKFVSLFSVDSAYDATNKTNAVASMVADQTVVLGENIVNGSPVYDSQRFVTKIQPAKTTQANYMISAASPSKVDFSADQTIQVVWIGQDIMGLGTFGAENLTNLSVVPGANVDSTTSFSSLSQTGPFNWADNVAHDNVLFNEFGTAPTF